MVDKSKIVDAVFISNIPKRITARTLRKDLSDLLQSEEFCGVKSKQSKNGTQMEETYRLSDGMEIKIITIESMGFRVNVEKIVTPEGQVTDRDKKYFVNALGIFPNLESRNFNSYSHLRQALSDFHLRYK